MNNSYVNLNRTSIIRQGVIFPLIYILINHRFCSTIVLFQFFDMGKRKADVVGRSKRMKNSQGSDNEQIMSDKNYDHQSFVLGKCLMA